MQKVVYKMVVFCFNLKNLESKPKCKFGGKRFQGLQVSYELIKKNPECDMCGHICL